MTPQRLLDEEIETRLQHLNEWTRNGDAIERSLSFDSFGKAIDFINRIARHAEDDDHHPEIFNVYNRIELKLTTHDASGLTHKDFDLAEKIDREVKV